VELQAEPPLDPALAKALWAVLEDVGPWSSEPGHYGDRWRRAAVTEGIEGDEVAFDYAFSPRRTRGATRA